jgi:predicted NUDIX family NTP pyrophosphohydrolase
LLGSGQHRSFFDWGEFGHIVYKKSKKEVHAFAGPAPADANPQLASWEIDHARFVPIEEARTIIYPDQAVFLDRLVEHLAANPQGSKTRPEA